MLISLKQATNISLIVALAAIPPSLFAFEIEFHPGLLINSQYTDNFYLDATKNEEIIGEVSPNFHLKGTGNRSKINADYLYRYRNTYGEKHESHKHIANGDANLDLIKNYLTISANGQTGIRSKSYTNSRLIEQNDLTDNTTQFSTVKTELKFDNHYKKRFDLNTSYMYNESYTKDRIFTDRKAQTINANIKNGTMYNRIEWSFSNQLKEEIYSLEPHKLYFTKFRLGYLIREKFNISATTGYEKLYKAATNNTTLEQGKILTSAAWWKPNKNLLLRSEYGERAFGEFYQVGITWKDESMIVSASKAREAIGDVLSFNLTKKNELIDISAGFNETLTTHELEYLQLVTSTGVEQDIPPPLIFETVKADETFKKQRYNASALIKGARNTLKFEAYVEKRNYLVRLPQGKEYGAGTNWTFQINNRNKFIAKVDAVQINDKYLKSDDRFGNLEVRYSRILNSNIKTTLRYTHWERLLSNNFTIENNKLSIDLEFTL